MRGRVCSLPSPGPWGEREWAVQQLLEASSPLPEAAAAPLPRACPSPVAVLVAGP